MKVSSLSYCFAIVGGLMSVTGCNVEESSLAKSDEAVVTPAVDQQTGAKSETLAHKIDPATAASLEAGLKVMQPRILSQIDGYSKIEPKAFRLFMHPDHGRNAVVELDTKGLTSITLSPYIFNLAGNKGCDGAKDSGIVDVIWSLDAGAPTKVTVDRNYAELLPIDITNTSRLRLEVTEGNGVPWCDWIGIGFIDLKS